MHAGNLATPIAKHTLAVLATSYCLNRNDRVSSFEWTRGSKLCFLTCFSYFSCYFLIQVFSQNCYLLISSRLSRLHGNLISCPVFCTFKTLQASRLYMRPHISGTVWVGFLKQDAHGNLVVDYRWFFPLPPFAKGFWCKRLLDWMQIIPFLLTKILELTLSRMTLSYAVQIGYGFPKGFSNSWIRLIVGFLVLCSKR